MNNICTICGSEKKYDTNHEKYKRCGVCNSRYVMKYYYNNKEKMLQNNKNCYLNHKEYFREHNRKRYTKVADLKNQIKELTEMLNTTVIVS